MVLKFQDYIEEGLWSKGINRSQTGEDRLEDKNPIEKYLKTVEWVDMGHPDYLYAVNDIDKPFSIDEIMDIDSRLPKDIRIVVSEYFRWITTGGYNKSKDLSGTNILCKKTQEFIFFNKCKDGDYFMGYNPKYGKKKQPMVFFVNTDKVDIVNGQLISPDDLDKPWFYIKLMKKKSMNEGLWSKGVERSHSGERRTEDKFTKGDIENFNQKIYNFMKKYDLGNTIDDFWEKSDETFEKPILDYAKAHGTLRLGFGPRDLSNLPDFDYTFYIPDLKNVMVHISYDDFEKEFKVMCGNDKDEFDIKDTTIGKYLITCITDILPQTLKKNPDVLLSNIKKNWKTFNQMLFDIVYKECYNNMMRNKKANYMISDIGAIISLIDLRNIGSEFDKFYMDKINMNTIPSRITIGNDIDVERSNPLFNKIINVCKKAYKQADIDTKEFERYK